MRFTELGIEIIPGRGRAFKRAGVILINPEHIILDKDKKMRSIKEMCYFINDIFLTEFLCMEIEYNILLWI